LENGTEIIWKNYRCDRWVVSWISIVSSPISLTYKLLIIQVLQVE